MRRQLVALAVALLALTACGKPASPADTTNLAAEKCGIDSRHGNEGKLHLPDSGGPETKVLEGDIRCMLSEVGLGEAEIATLFDHGYRYEIDGEIRITSRHDSFGGLYTIEPITD